MKRAKGFHHGAHEAHEGFILERSKETFVLFVPFVVHRSWTIDRA